MILDLCVDMASPLRFVSLSHGVEEQRAVLSLCSREDAGQRRQRALWQGTAGPQVAGDDLLVQAQLARDAVERLRVQIQDGDRVRESRRSGGEEVPELPLTAGGGGGGERRGINEQWNRRMSPPVGFYLVLQIDSQK